MWDTPPRTVDPIFLCELALELKMPVGELHQRMTEHELTVLWPAYFRSRNRVQRKQEEEQRRKARQRGRRV